MKTKKRGTSGETAGESHGPADAPAGPRERIMDATFAVLMERGYAGASTLEIATRAKVSKREIYALFGDKRGILVQMIARRATEMQRALTLPVAVNRDAVATTLIEFGTTLLHEVCHPVVTALFRVAIAEAEGDPEMARVLDENGRGIQRPALVAFLQRASQLGLIGAEADPEQMAGQFLSLLFGDVLLRVILRVAERPSRRDCALRARRATETVLRLYPLTSSA
ncbi:transcriptional regulator, TetR family [Enhydrobacter aerosaccus]|uniref:Transcriptional regulator, TetR family n=1 Tax=Enhydrobacter aerosaccus TaxID=225324 RepID=A0A1T4SZQ7_9HYPH|nr:TetR/AcrR family transcriptional regulator [Enhydrobacter aerosaccus]SKA33657.1 transcriptional regulator, TetR family [Enhydrobacter aerosaccus]